MRERLGEVAAELRDDAELGAGVGPERDRGRACEGEGRRPAGRGEVAAIAVGGRAHEELLGREAAHDKVSLGGGPAALGLYSGELLKGFVVRNAPGFEEWLVVERERLRHIAVGLLRQVSEADALSHVAGYCVVNDVSEREYQIERGGTWDKGKGCDTFGPIGPWLVTKDEVADPQALRLWLEVNGERMQDSSTSDMIFSCAEIVSYVSRFMTLLPGDVICTGTPQGVGMGRGRFLQVGDRVRLGVEGLGEQEQTVIASR